MIFPYGAWVVLCIVGSDQSIYRPHNKHMEKQELQAVQELYNLIHQWQEKYTVGWVNTSDFFKRFYRGVKHLEKSLRVLTNTEHLPCVTVEEKAANAVFYIEDNITYRIIYSMIEEGYMIVEDIDDNGDEVHVELSSIPANAYFLGTIKL